MSHTPPQFLNISLVIALAISSTNMLSQNLPFWSNNGNNVSSTDFFGSTNAADLRFRTNNLARMTLTSAGTLRVNSLAGAGSGFVSLDVNGNLLRANFTNDTNQVLSGDGTFKNISSIGGWKFSGNNIYNSNSGTVGIGTSSPSSGYLLDVNGDAHFSGNIFASGLVLTTKVQADTIRSLSQISINNNLVISAGAQNELYTNSNDLLIQSASAYTQGNTILNSGNSGKVGIGNLNPVYKLDVNGDFRASGKIYSYRIVPLPGDSIIRFGDSTVNFLPQTNTIYGSTATGYKGLGLGVGTLPFGLHSTAIGYRVVSGAPAENSVTIGSGVTNGTYFINNVPNSLAVGFNSNTPTLFVTASSGVNTTGKVGIGTSNPQYDLDVNGTLNATQILQNGQPVFQWSQTGDNIYFDQNNVTGGSVGIGVTSSTSFFTCPTCNGGKYLLAVNGGIRAKVLKVEPLWSDYVFDSTYVLAPLDTVANYIQANHHLPNVQSAEDVKQNGIDVGETDAVLLAKIEELTLYMIQLQQQNAAMQKEIDELKKKPGRSFFLKKPQR